MHSYNLCFVKFFTSKNNLHFSHLIHILHIFIWLFISWFPKFCLHKLHSLLFKFKFLFFFESLLICKLFILLKEFIKGSNSLIRYKLSISDLFNKDNFLFQISAPKILKEIKLTFLLFSLILFFWWNKYWIRYDIIKSFGKELSLVILLFFNES